MNVKRTLLTLGFAVSSAAATLASAPALADVYVRFGPPAPRYEVVPVLPSGWVWAPGYWNWNGHRYVWVRGHRVHARHGYRWVEPRWREDHGRWHREHGRWDRD